MYLTPAYILNPYIAKIVNGIENDNTVQKSNVNNVFVKSITASASPIGSMV